MDKERTSRPLEISPSMYVIMAILLSVSWIASLDTEPPEIKPRPFINRCSNQTVALKRLGIQVRLAHNWAMLDVTNWSRKRMHFVNAADQTVLYLEQATGISAEPVKPADENFHVVDLDQPNQVRSLTVSWDGEPEKLAGWLRRSATIFLGDTEPIRITAFSISDPAKSKQIVSFLASIGEL